MLYNLLDIIQFKLTLTKNGPSLLYWILYCLIGCCFFFLFNVPMLTTGSILWQSFRSITKRNVCTVTCFSFTWWFFSCCHRLLHGSLSNILALSEHDCYSRNPSGHNYEIYVIIVDGLVVRTEIWKSVPINIF